MKLFIENLFYDFYYKVLDHINGSDAYNLIVTSQRMRFHIPTRTAAQVAAVLLWAADMREIDSSSTMEDLSFTWTLRKPKYEDEIYAAMKKLMDASRAQ